MSSKNDWGTLLRDTKVKDLVKTKLITVDYYAPLSHVWEVLRKNNILSVPVLKKVEHRWTPMGFIDVLDVAAFMVYMSRQWNKDWQENELLFIERQFSQTQALEVINFSNFDTYAFVKESDSLEDAVKAMTKQKHVYWRFHRLAVHDDKDQLVGIVSQSDIIRFADQRLDLIPLGNSSLKELNLIRGCVMMKESDPLGDVLETLANNRIYGIARINQQNQLVGNFSASDLRGVSKEVFSKFHDPVMDFLRSIGSPKTPIAESPSTKLKDCIHMLADKRVHRLYLVDNDNHPIGVASLSDIMPLLLERPTPQAV